MLRSHCEFARVRVALWNSPRVSHLIHFKRKTPTIIIAVSSFSNIKFLLIFLWDRSEIFNLFKNQNIFLNASIDKHTSILKMKMRESDNFPHFSILCCLVSFLLFMFHEFYSFPLVRFLLPSCFAVREWKDEANESKYQHVRLCNLMPFRLNPSATAVAWIFLSFVFYFWTNDFWRTW